jgi:predicted phage terminase large subunit-like protein
MPETWRFTERIWQSVEFPLTTSATVSLSLPKSPYDYDSIFEALRAEREEVRRGHLRNLFREDLYCLLRFGLRRPDTWEPPPPTDTKGHRIWLSREWAGNERNDQTLGPTDWEREEKLLRERKERHRRWVFDRCRQFQESPDGHLDLWPRGHYKSTTITFAGIFWEILKDQNIRIAILSQTNPTAEEHLTTLQREFEENELLKEIFPDIFYRRPAAESPLWSKQKGLLVRRTRPAKEPTLSCFGLVDGLPAGPHYDLMVFDDTVTKDSVSTPDQIRKTTEAWEHSLGLRSAGCRVRYVGTVYHLSDTYKEIEKRGAARVRKYSAEDPETGEAAMLSAHELASIRETMGSKTYASQMMQDPRADSALGFRREWLRTYAARPEDLRKGMNVIVCVDPAHSKKKESDYTAGVVVGLGADQNYYILDMVRDRIGLTQRADLVFRWHRKWQPLGIFYEQYGLQADIEHISDRMERENYRFNIVAVGGQVSKRDRIMKLAPPWEAGRIWLPGLLHYVDYESRTIDLVQVFLDEEYTAFPVGAHDDMLDSMARMLDPGMNVGFPSAQGMTQWKDPRSKPRGRKGGGWQTK